MAKPGDSYTISGVGETITLLRTAEATGGESLAWRVDLAPRANMDLDHLHPEQHQRFTVLDGRIGFEVGGRPIPASPGDVVEVPPGTPHTFLNRDDSPAAMEVEIAPALRTQDFMESIGALIHAGRTGRSGLPRWLQMVVLLREHRREIRPTRVPRWLVATLGVIGRIGGHSPRHRFDPDASASTRSAVPPGTL